MKSIWVKKESTVGSQAVLPQNGNPEEDLKDYAIIDSGCSGSMTGDKDKLSDFKELRWSNWVLHKATKVKLSYGIEDWGHVNFKNITNWLRHLLKVYPSKTFKRDSFMSGHVERITLGKFDGKTQKSHQKKAICMGSSLAATVLESIQWYRKVSSCLSCRLSLRIGESKGKDSLNCFEQAIQRVSNTELRIFYHPFTLPSKLLAAEEAHSESTHFSGMKVLQGEVRGQEGQTISQATDSKLKAKSRNICLERGKKQKKKVSSVKLGRNKDEGNLSEENHDQDDHDHNHTTFVYEDECTMLFVAVTPDLERKSDETEQVIIEEEKDTSDVKSGDTEELDLERIQSPSSLIRQTQEEEPEEQFKDDEFLADIFLNRPRDELKDELLKGLRIKKFTKLEKEKQMLQERDAKRLLRKRKATVTEEQPSKKLKLRT
ncbi:hypothetical protein Tco_0469511 [Tanacetum coccineum]